mmetsp:Transcript_29552/g.95399  ORF Transcript_29552/g.95399 Transcript_29552/m.95399 type:complete len:702 (+) Transcript_29552:58-2163(+)|eukprot:scaffold12672_cov112-Isochrysis_galbana.AAC.1
MNQPVQSALQLPCTLEQAVRPSADARIITEAREPFRIVHVNDVWCKVCGVDAEESLGKTCATLQGRGTSKTTLAMLRQALMLGRHFSVQLLNYTQRGRPFMSTLRVAPLMGNTGQQTHFLGLITAQFLDGGGPVPPSVQLYSEPAPTPGISPELELEDQLSGSSAEGSDDIGYPDLYMADFSSELPEDRDCDGDGAGSSAGDSVTGGPCLGGGRVPPFLTKLSEILSQEPAEAVTLDPEHAAFHIADAPLFAREVLPRYFKHNKLGSFSQQLHTYGFRRKPTATETQLSFYHERYDGEPAAFLSWIRSGGAQLQPKREKERLPSYSPRPSEPGPPPPAALMQSLNRLQEDIRRLSVRFEQAKSAHTMSLRAVLMRMVRQGKLSPEQAGTIATLREAPADAPQGVDGSGGGGAAGWLSSGWTARPAPEPIRQVGLLGGGWRNSPALGSLSADGLQAQLDALEAGLPPLSTAAATLGGDTAPLPLGEAAVLSGLRLEKTPSDLKGDEALALFAEVEAPTPLFGPELAPSPGLSPLDGPSFGLSPLGAISPSMLSPLGAPPAISLLSAGVPQGGCSFFLTAAEPAAADVATLGLDSAPPDAPPLASPLGSADPPADGPRPPSLASATSPLTGEERVPPFPVSPKRQSPGSELARAQGAAHSCEGVSMHLLPAAAFSEAVPPLAKRHCASPRAEAAVPASSAVGA